MTPIEIARKCIAEISDGWGEQEDEKAAREIEPVIRAAIAAEREACAETALTIGSGPFSSTAGWNLSNRIAAAIRARGQ